MPRNEQVDPYGPCHLCHSESVERHGTVLWGPCACGAHCVELCDGCADRAFAGAPPPCRDAARRMGYDDVVERLMEDSSQRDIDGNYVKLYREHYDRPGWSEALVHALGRNGVLRLVLGDTPPEDPDESDKAWRDHAIPWLEEYEAGAREAVLEFFDRRDEE